MISFERAYKIVLSHAFTTGSESVSFMSSAGRVLAEKVRSDIDIPPFDKSAVDGYACRRENLGMELEMLEVVSAGMQPEYTIEAATCAKVMTGAPVPEGADFVFMVEDALITDGGKVIFTGKSSKDNISRTGEDVRTGDVVLERGIQIRPQDIAVMASVGCTLVKVSRMPRVGIISTGSELVEPSSRPGMSQIRNSNAYQLLAQAERAGGTGRYYGIAIDEEEVTYQMLTRALEENDVVMLTGGVSMGDFDFVPAVLRRAGVEILFDRVAVQPGKPTTFGVHKNCLVFGLPGNPVSSFIQFELLVRPLIMKMMGCKWSGVEWNVPLAEEYRRKNSSRLGFIPVKINRKGMAVPVEYHGSAHISALPLADGIVAIPEGVNLLEKGEIVNVRQV
jgi:molybdopterin molybdotransferase